MGMFSTDTDQTQEPTTSVDIPDSPAGTPMYYRHGACGQRTLAGSFKPTDKELPCAICQSCPSATEFTWE